MRCRLVDVTDTELTQFLEEQENPNTKRKVLHSNSKSMQICSVLDYIHPFKSFHLRLHLLTNFFQSSLMVSERKVSQNMNQTILGGFLSSIQHYLWLHYFQNQRCSVQSLNGYAQSKTKGSKSKSQGFQKQTKGSEWQMIKLKNCMKPNIFAAKWISW